MINVSDIKEFAGFIGVPSSVVLIVISLFNWGFVPSILTEIKDDALTTKVKVEHQQKLLERSIEQHNEQMHNLNAALKQICINTAKNDNRVHDCLKIDSYLTR